MRARPEMPVSNSKIMPGAGTDTVRMTRSSSAKSLPTASVVRSVMEKIALVSEPEYQVALIRCQVPGLLGASEAPML